MGPGNTTVDPSEGAQVSELPSFSEAACLSAPGFRCLADPNYQGCACFLLFHVSKGYRASLVALAKLYDSLSSPAQTLKLHLLCVRGGFCNAACNCLVTGRQPAKQQKAKVRDNTRLKTCFFHSHSKTLCLELCSRIATITTVALTRQGPQLCIAVRFDEAALAGFGACACSSAGRYKKALIIRSFMIMLGPRAGYWFWHRPVAMGWTALCFGLPERTS